MPKISEFVQFPENYGVVAVMPQPRPGSPWHIFDVVEDDFNAGSPTMQIWVNPQEFTSKFGAATLARNDLLLHLNSGVVCRVVERLGQHHFRVEAWSKPDGANEEHTRESFAWWNAKQAKGQWVVWGVCYGPGDAMPFNLPEEVFSGPNATDAQIKEYMEARLDLSKNDDFKSFKRKPTPKVRLSKKQRRKLQRRARELADRQWFESQQATPEEAIPALEDITPEEIDRRTFFRKKLSNGELKQWVLSLEEISAARDRQKE